MDGSDCGRNCGIYVVLVEKSKQKRAGNYGLRGMYRKLLQSMTLIGTSCGAMCVECRARVFRDMPTKKQQQQFDFSLKWQEVQVAISVVLHSLLLLSVVGPLLTLC